jgi:glucokinase
VGQAARKTGIGTQAQTQTLLAADVGGTHARVALVRVTPSAPAAQAVEVLSFRKYVCAEHTGLDRILEVFLQDSGAMHIDAGAIACAGYVLDGQLINANLPWGVNLAPLRERLGLDLALVNDFEAVAYATPFIPTSEATLMTGSPEPVRGPVLVVGPGTGLGAALCLPTQPPHILATEAGHAALAPGEEIEVAVVERLLQRAPYVANEHLLSGPGLVNLYTCLADLRGVAPSLTTPAAITAAAQADSDSLAVQALEVFCGLLGSMVGDLALLYRAEGGVYLAGGIPAQIKPFLLRSRFVERFLNKGALRALLQTIPVRLIDHGQLGVIGAATWYAQQRLGDSNAIAAGARR